MCSRPRACRRCIDLALALVEFDYGPDLVREVARALGVYLKRAGGQSQFSVLSRLIRFARARLEAGRTVKYAALLAGFASPETLRRVFINPLWHHPQVVSGQIRRHRRVTAVGLCVAFEFPDHRGRFRPASALSSP